MLVPPEDVEALAEAIRRLAADADARRRMGTRGRDYVVRGWSRQMQAERLLAVLQDAVAHRRRS